MPGFAPVASYPVAAPITKQSFTQAIAATCSTAASVVNQTGKNITATVTEAVSTLKQAGKLISATQATAVSVLKQVGKIIIVGLSNAVSFNASTAFIKIANLYGSGAVMPLSVSVWFKTTMSGNSGTIVGTTSTGLSDPSVGPTGYENLLYIDTTNKLFGGWYDGGIEGVQSSSTVNDGAWHHAVITAANSSVVQMFLDNVSQGTHALGTADTTTPDFWLGKNQDNTWPNTNHNYSFAGEIIDVRFYNRVISSGEVSTLFNGGDVTSGLVGRYLDPRATSVSANDLSGNGNNGTIFGSPSASIGDGPSALGGAVTTVASVFKQVGKIISTTSATSMTFGAKTIGKIVTAAQAQTVSTIKAVSKFLSMTQASTVTVVAVKAFLVTISATCTTVASLGSKTVGKIVSATQAQTVSTGKAVSKFLSITQAQTVSVIKSVGKIVLATQASTVTAVGAKVRLVLISVTQATSVTVSRAVSKSLAMTQAQSVAVVKRVNKALAMSSATTAVVVKSVLKQITATQATAVTFGGKTVSKLVTMSQATAVSVGKLVGKIVSVVQATVASIVALRPVVFRRVAITVFRRK